MKKNISLGLVINLLSTHVVVADTAHLSAWCRKNSDRGCTAHQRICKTLPPNHYVVEGSVSSGVLGDWWAKNPTCYPAELDGWKAVSGTGLPQPPRYPSQICATLHIESGSGGGNMGRKAVVNCTYTYESFKYP